MGCGRSLFYYRKAGRIKTGLDGATLERLSHLLGIYAALQILPSVPERVNAWIKKPNTASLLGSGTALQRMLGRQVADLYVVRQYLDAQRGGRA